MSDRDNNRLHDRVQNTVRRGPGIEWISMIGTVPGWGSAAYCWSEAMELLFWLSLIVFFLMATFRTKNTDARSDPVRVRPSLSCSTDQSENLMDPIDLNGTQISSGTLSDLAPQSGVSLEAVGRVLGCARFVFRDASHLWDRGDN